MTTTRQPKSPPSSKRQPKSIILRWRCLAFSLLMLLVTAPVSFAQTTGSATLRGTVKDPNGAVVPNATVTLVSNRSQNERRTTASDEGTYIFTSVDPGPYTLRVEAANFKTSVQADLVLSPNDFRGKDVALEIGAPSETVVVAADASATLQTETGEKSNTITSKQIENLSLIGRNSLELLRILPGVVPPDGPDLEVTSFTTGANATASYSVNGQRGRNNSVTIDGSRVVEPDELNGTMITANNDMVQEVKVQTSNYAAEYGSSGVQITAVTKSGGNDFHGTLYLYSRPYQLQANDRSRTIQGFKPDGEPQSPRPMSKFNYPGGNLSGPVFLPRFGEGGKPYWSGKNKLFFFFGLEFQRQLVDAGIRTAVVPTLKQRLGDFSEFLPGGIYNCPTCPNLNQAGVVTIPGIPGRDPGAGLPAPNNNLAPYIDPIGRALINLYPLPGFNPSRAQNYNYLTGVLQPINRIDSKARFDYKHGDKANIFLRVARESELQDKAFGYINTFSNMELPSHVLGNNIGRSAALGITSIFSPTMSNEVVFSATQLKLDDDFVDPEKVSLEALGIGNLQLPFGRSTNYPPALYRWGQGFDNLWSGLAGPNFANNTNFSVTENLTKVHKSHTFKFGGLIEQVNSKRNDASDAAGALVLGAPWSQNATRNDFGDLLAGRPTAVFHSTASPNISFRLYNIEGYAQDAWKVRPNITLEYGLRVVYMTNNYERSGLGTTFDPSTYIRGGGRFINGDPLRPNGILSARKGEVPYNVLPNNPPQLAPRLGFAWDIGGKSDLVVRGGAGLFYNRERGHAQYTTGIFHPPFGMRKSATNVFEFPDMTVNRLGLINPIERLFYTVDVTDPKSNHIPRTATMSLSVAKRLPFQNILEVAYVGTQGRHLPNWIEINVIQPGTLLTGTVTDPGNPAEGRAPAQLNLSNPVQRAALSGPLLNTFRPFPDLERVLYHQYNATSSYHSLQATLSRQLGRNLQYFATYTFSKVLGTLGNGFNVDPIDTRGRSWGVLDFDRTHIANLSYNYYLPDLARGGFKNFLTRGVLNGWQLSGISTYQSGTPIRLRFTGGGINANAMSLAFFGTDAFNTGSGASGGIAPVYLQNPIISSTGNVGDRVLDIKAIAIPGLGQSGPTVAPFYIRAPSRNFHDISFFKNFKFDGDGTKRLQFRAGFFNVFNQAFPRNINPVDANNSDINLALETECLRTVNGVRDGSGGIVNNLCDPAGGFRFTQNTLDNFGKINLKRGHRIVEMALKFYF
ncbi:hypothetical protein BH18ACI4_BH18ACI4_18720 [soil metagenome]